jgi:hypothetical protein
MTLHTSPYSENRTHELRGCLLFHDDCATEIPDSTVIPYYSIILLLHKVQKLNYSTPVRGVL